MKRLRTGAYSTLIAICSLLLTPGRVMADPVRVVNGYTQMQVMSGEDLWADWTLQSGSQLEFAATHELGGFITTTYHPPAREGDLLDLRTVVQLPAVSAYGKLDGMFGRVNGMLVLAALPAAWKPVAYSPPQGGEGYVYLQMTSTFTLTGNIDFTPMDGTPALSGPVTGSGVVRASAYELEGPPLVLEYLFDEQPSAVPEPATALLVAAGALALTRKRWRACRRE